MQEIQHKFNFSTQNKSNRFLSLLFVDRATFWHQNELAIGR
jgi:hypothetical protein